MVSNAERMHAYLRGMECGLMGDDNEPEELSGPLLNIFRKVKDKIKARIANKTVAMNFNSSGGSSAPTVSDNAVYAAPAPAAGLPSWAIPAGIGAIGLIAVITMMKGKK